MPDVSIEELQAEFNVLKGRCERAKLNRASLLEQAEAELAEEHRAEGAAATIMALIQRLQFREVAPPTGGAAKGGEGTAKAGATTRSAKRGRARRAA